MNTRIRRRAFRTPTIVAAFALLFGCGGGGDSVSPQTGATPAVQMSESVTVLSKAPPSAVTFTVTGLPSGMTYDAQSGFITGRPTTTFNSSVSLSANDG